MVSQKLNEKVQKLVSYTGLTQAPILSGYLVNFRITGSHFRQAKYVQLDKQEAKSGISG